MIIDYYFGPNEELFEYNAELQDYIDSLKIEDIVDKASLIYRYYLTDKDKEALKEYGVYGFEFFSDMNTKNPDQINIVKHILEGIDDKLFEEIFEDDIKKYFEDEALEMYEDTKQYNKDPLEYFGMRQSDFL